MSGYDFLAWLGGLSNPTDPQLDDINPTLHPDRFNLSDYLDDQPVEPMTVDDQLEIEAATADFLASSQSSIPMSEQVILLIHICT